MANLAADSRHGIAVTLPHDSGEACRHGFAATT